MTPVLWPSVKVMQPLGESTYAQATAEETSPGVLTVTYVDPDQPACVYQPGQWTEARIYHASADEETPDTVILNHQFEVR